MNMGAPRDSWSARAPIILAFSNLVSVGGPVTTRPPLLVISTPHGVGKYHFNCIGYKNSEILLEFILIIDHDFKDSDLISTEIGNKYYLTINQFLLAYKNLAFS